MASIGGWEPESGGLGSWHGNLAALQMYLRNFDGIRLTTPPPPAGSHNFNELILLCLTHRGAAARDYPANGSLLSRDCFALPSSVRRCPSSFVLCALALVLAGSVAKSN